VQITPNPGWESRPAESGADSSSPNTAAPSFDIPPALKSLQPSEAESACKFLWNGLADEKDANWTLTRFSRLTSRQHALFTRALADCANAWHKRDIRARIKQWSSDRQRRMQAETKIGEAISLLDSSLKGVRTNLVELGNLPAVVANSSSSRTAVAKAEVLSDLVRDLTALRLLIEDAHKRLHGSLSKRGKLGQATLSHATRLTTLCIVGKTSAPPTDELRLLGYRPRTWTWDKAMRAVIATFEQAVTPIGDQGPLT
jgi:hypothetical protein